MVRTNLGVQHATNRGAKQDFRICNCVGRRPMKPKTKILVCLVVFAFIDVVIPLPLTALLLIYVLSEKPPWFRKLVREVYDS